ncbi:C2H2-type zinc finger transcription factor [Rhizophagus clarus]|nr:C2H2-type zinc finger transcription factor [Rhizophagus clarus]
MEPKLDYDRARKWNRERSRQVHIYQPTINEFSGNLNGNVTTTGTVNGGTFVTGFSKETRCSPIVSERSDEQTMPSEAAPSDSSFEYIPSDESDQVRRESTIFTYAESMTKADNIDAATSTSGATSKRSFELMDSDLKEEDTLSIIFNSSIDEEIKISEETSVTSAASSSDNDNELTFGVDDMELFTKRYLAMKDDKKWKLSTGRYVEDILYNLGKKCNYHNLIHSFIIDPEDKFVHSGFTMEELQEICETKSMQEPPQIDDDLLQYIDSFAKDSTKDIRKALYSPHPRLCENYNPLVDFAYEHVRTTVSDWVRLLEMEPNPLTITQDLPESWFRINVWRTLDIAFSDIPFTFFVGGEKAGLATRERKNRSRTLSNIGPMQRKAVGRKGDGYVRSIGSRSIDWAASEAGSKWEGDRGTKLIKECDLILPKVLKDIFINLARKTNFEEDKVRKINIPGFIHAGAVLVKTNLDCPKGYTCRYMKEDPLEIYADVTQFNRTLDALVSIIYAKYVILQTMKIVNEDKSENLKRWKNLRKAERTEVSDCHPTPKKRRVVDLNQK